MVEVKSKGEVWIVQIWTDESPLTCMIKSRTYPTSKYSSKTRTLKLQFLGLAKQKQFTRNRKSRASLKDENPIGMGLKIVRISRPERSKHALALEGRAYILLQNGYKCLSPKKWFIDKVILMGEIF